MEPVPQPQPQGRWILEMAKRINKEEERKKREEEERKKREEEERKKREEEGMQYKREYEEVIKQLGIQVCYSPEFVKQGYELQIFSINKNNYQVVLRYQTDIHKQQQIVIATTKLSEHSYEEAVRIIRELIDDTIIFSSKKALKIENKLIELEQKGIKITTDGFYIITSPKIEKQNFIRFEYTPKEIERLQNPPSSIKTNLIRDAKEAILIEKFKSYIINRCKIAEKQKREKSRKNKRVETLTKVQKREEEEYILIGVKFNDLTGFRIQKSRIRGNKR